MFRHLLLILCCDLYMYSNFIFVLLFGSDQKRRLDRKSTCNKLLLFEYCEEIREGRRSEALDLTVALKGHSRLNFLVETRFSNSASKPKLAAQTRIATWTKPKLATPTQSHRLNQNSKSNPKTKTLTHCSNSDIKVTIT